MNPRTGKASSSTDKATWGTYEEARRRSNNIGFVFDGSGYVGIDLDSCVDGGALNPFAREIMSQCRSYTEFSPSATGIHIIAKGRLDAALKLPGLEVYDRGRYFTVTEKPLQPLFPLRTVGLGFLDKFRPSNATQQPLDLGTKLNGIREGSRNNDFMSIAGSLRAKNYSPESIFELLKPKARELDFPEDELRGICDRMKTYAPHPAYSSPAATASPLEAFLADEERVDWIVPGVIAKGTIGFVAGLPESMKTWALMDLALEVARGGEWLGRFKTNRAKVMLVDQERAKSETQRRIKAMIAGKGLEVSEISGYIDIRSGTSTRINLPQSFEAFKKVLDEVRPELVIVDSFATWHTVEESNRMEIQKVLELTKQLKNEFGCAFMFVHHETKMAFQQAKDGQAPTYLDMAGNVAIPAAAETVFNVRRHDGESSFVHHTKNTLGTKLQPFLIRVRDLNTEKTKILVEAF